MINAIIPLMAAAALAAPQLRDRLADADVPVNTGEGSAIYEIFVAPDGWVDDCDVVKSDYTARQDELVCRHLLREKARKSARGTDGKPVHATVLVTRNRGSGDPMEYPFPPDIVLDVAAAPGMENGEKVVALNVLVDADGVLQSCEAARKGDETFADAACQQAKAIEFRQREDRNGTAVPYLTEVTAEFVADSSAT